MLDLDKPFPGFEHASLGPLPIDPKIIRLKTEVESWQKKYNQVFDEQCQTRSLETALRVQLNTAIQERDKLKAMVEAQKELIQWLADKK